MLICLAYVAFMLFAAALLAETASTSAGGYDITRDIPYVGEDRRPDDYRRQRCRLDLCVPTGKSGLATVVWFHGGGLIEGDKAIPEPLRQDRFMTVSPGYRFFPKVAARDCIVDAAAAVAWTCRNVARYGGDPAKILLSGHSAGAYLASMLLLDKRWLAAHDIDADSLAGLMALSGQMITHSAVREGRGIPAERPVVDEFSALYHLRPDAPPILMITGERKLENRCRYEENAYMAAMLKMVGHPDVTLIEIPGYGHDMREPGFPEAFAWMADRFPETADQHADG